MLIRFLLTSSLFILLSFCSLCQIDKEFWFAVPYASPINGDSPVFLRFHSFDQPANVTIDIPANPNFKPITVQITSNGSVTVNMTQWLALLENNPPDVISNKGLHILSDQQISVYYDLYGTSSYAPGTNSDYFPLKGSNGLGLEFYTPFQTRWDNQVNINAWASFDLVATQDQTLVEIIPSTTIVNHSAGMPFTVSLNKGQTWSAWASTITATLRPTGSYIKSNKPIAVTVKDDSMLDSTDWDIGGDQLVPINQLGTEYIVMQHTNNVSTQNDFAYVLAIQDNTSIFLSGSAVAYAMLQTGQQIEIPINTPLYITTTNPVYVLHCTGFGNELGEAVVPKLSCTGSKNVGFYRSNDEVLVLNVLTTNGNQGNFSLNGNTSLINASDFKAVPGTTNWLQASKILDITQVPSGLPNVFSNSSGSFHLSIMNGLAYNTGFRYGYFADYGSLPAISNRTICPGDSIQLSAGIQNDSYLWTPNGSTSYFIFAKDSGTYTVTATKSTCIFKDTVHIAFYPKPVNVLDNVHDTICDKQSVIINAKPGFNHFQWSSGSSFNYILVGSQGTYYVTAKDTNGCTAHGTATVTVLPLPQGSIDYLPSDNKIFCSTSDTLVSLSAPLNYKSYLWYNGSTAQSIQTPRNNDGMYWVTLTDTNGCYNKITLNVDCSTYIDIPNLITANNDGKNDFFDIEGLIPNTYALEVYNRWGDLIYKNNSYNNDWYPSGNISDGIYYYSLIHYKNEHNLKGWVQVIH